MKIISRFYAHHFSAFGDYSVLSLHRKAINFVNAQGQLFSIHPSVRYITPFGIVVSHTDFQYLYKTLIPTQTILCKKNQLILNNDVHLVFSGRILNTTLHVRNIPSNHQFYLQNFDRNFSDYPLEQKKRLGLITNFLIKPNKATTLELINSIGFGRGLTPSFDDSLIGMLAILYLKGQKERYFPILDSYLKPQFLLQNTTYLSANFILSALQGAISYPFYRFLYKLTMPRTNFPFALANFLNYGHSSGFDTLLGMKTTLLTLQQEKI
ncbi:DUF2877 domain-containing protein [Avibacterium volantium]|uniref:Protein of uncharacterized function (DUF2877) n=1 Tax=Avibacterium volantium TaxID=762 RepID=A0A3S4GYJ8_AVIVO|nr:DUF2877 domain-containing protein [Avibacterium volantium]VEB22891.1 Protein of uncharacterised function (DUF2877) [Avibacterium volantium]